MAEAAAPARRKRLALVCAHGTLDAAWPTLILATTAAAMGWEVGVFCTFYGFDLIHRDRQQKLAVSPLANPAMPVKIPALVAALPGMEAAATAMMKSWAKRQNLASVPELFQMARELGVTFYACHTTMAMMGVQEEEVIEGVEFAGAPAFLDLAGESDVQLYI